jgi:hypothetical protein
VLDQPTKGEEMYGMGWMVLFGAGVGWITAMIHLEKGDGLGLGLMAGTIVPCIVGCFLIWLGVKYEN